MSRVRTINALDSRRLLVDRVAAILAAPAVLFACSTLFLLRLRWKFDEALLRNKSRSGLPADTSIVICRATRIQ